MSVKKYLDYAGLQRYDDNWKLKFQEMIIGDEEVEDLFNREVLHIGTDPWSFTINTEATNEGENKTGIPFNLYGQENITLTVDWGDNTQSVLSSSDYEENDGSASIHEYSTPGIYQVTVQSNDWLNTYPISIDYGMYVEYIDDGSEFLQYWRNTLTSFNSILPTMKGMFLGSWDVYPFTAKDNSLNSLFAHCEKLEYINQNIFENNTNITDLCSCFYCCESLPSIPNGLLNDMAYLTDVSTLFCGCILFTSLPSDLFASNPLIQNFGGCFSGCEALESIPSGLFDSNTAATDFSVCFSYCHSLTSVPTGLFNHNAQVTTFQMCFNECISLANIPSRLFDNCTQTIRFDMCFRGCSIQSIPSGLFDNNTAATTFSGCFRECSIQSIPSGLFDNNTAATSFGSCFSGCTSLTSIPSGLFDNNTAVTSFQYCFSSCPSIQSIPSELFDNNTAVTDFYGCFNGCSSLNDFTLHIGSSLVSYCTSFVTKKANTNRIVYVPDGSTTQTKFNAVASSLGLTIVGE